MRDPLTKQEQALSELRFVISGHETPITVSLEKPLYFVIPAVLEQTGNTGRDPAEWEVRNVRGVLLSLHHTFAQHLIQGGDLIFLSPQVGAGGSTSETSNPTSNERLSRKQVYLGKDRDELGEIIVDKDIEIERLRAEAKEAYNRGFAIGSGQEGYYQREIKRLRAALQSIVNKYHPDGNPMYLHDIALDALSGESPSDPLRGSLDEILGKGAQGKPDSGSR